MGRKKFTSRHLSNHNLFSNRSAEKDIRNWLTESGFSGRTARFAELELHAIKRPGWLQVFRFSTDVENSEGLWQTVYGVLRDDERYQRLDIEVFDDLQLRDQRLVEWSIGLITARRRFG